MCGPCPAATRGTMPPCMCHAFMLKAPLACKRKCPIPALLTYGAIDRPSSLGASSRPLGPVQYKRAATAASISHWSDGKQGSLARCLAPMHACTRRQPAAACTPVRMSPWLGVPIGTQHEQSMAHDGTRSIALCAAFAATMPPLQPGVQKTRFASWEVASPTIMTHPQLVERVIFISSGTDSTA